MSRLITRYLWAACDVGLGRSYGHKGESTQDCIRFQIAKLKSVYPGVDFAAHTETLHLAFEGAVGSFANMETLASLGVGDIWDKPLEPGIYECQGWGSYGHAFTLLMLPSGDLWIMDSHNKTTDWLRPITWDKVQATWPNRMLVRLRRPA